MNLAWIDHRSGALSPVSLFAYDRAYRAALLTRRRLILSLILGVGVQVLVLDSGHVAK